MNKPSMTRNPNLFGKEPTMTTSTRFVLSFVAFISIVSAGCFHGTPPSTDDLATMAQADLAPDLASADMATSADLATVDGIMPDATSDDLATVDGTMPADLGTAADQAIQPDLAPAPACNDNAKNGIESDVDCGGKCPACANGKGCNGGGDCASGVCTNNVCMPTPVDMAMGPADMAVVSDMAMVPKADMAMVPDLAPAPTCKDGKKNGTESDVDCGGDFCAQCWIGWACLQASDCFTKLCSNGTCISPPSCWDGKKNGDETDVDCGGKCGATCLAGESCIRGSDCNTGNCLNNVCAVLAPSCGDNIQDGQETDVDCGGGGLSPCFRCKDTARCLQNSDCANNTCLGGVCVSCLDGKKDQDETDVDCGGKVCSACGDGKACKNGPDCSSTICTNLVCVPKNPPPPQGADMAGQGAADLAMNQGDGGGVPNAGRVQIAASAKLIATCASPIQIVAWGPDVPVNMNGQIVLVPNEQISLAGKPLDVNFNASWQGTLWLSYICDGNYGAIWVNIAAAASVSTYFDVMSVGGVDVRGNIKNCVPKNGALKRPAVEMSGGPSC
ncbi:hypothetical protein EXS71_01750 [Candidatus Uhrbacteria bacterium]|nr:hypothetical protein [Candidatus Uhrbacteria bacterium]